MSKSAERYTQLSYLTPDIKTKNPLSKKIRAGISFLERELTRADLQSVNVSSRLEGTDNGLYKRLVDVARDLNYQIRDDGSAFPKSSEYKGKGVILRTKSGQMIGIEPGTPLEMVVVLGHELAHHFIPHIRGCEDQMETVAEATSFVICHFYGLDTSRVAFPNIRKYHSGKFMRGMRDDIERVSTSIVSLIENNKRLQEMYEAQRA